jgi:PKD repeat protein
MDTRAQSETVGAILLVGLVVVSVSAVGYATVQRGTATDDAPSVSVSVRVTNASVTLVHDGGDAVRTAGLEVIVREDGADRGLTWAGGSLDGDGDGRFGPGEEWTAGVALDPDATVRVLLIDRATETVLADRTVEPTVSADPAGLNAPPDPAFTYSPAAPTDGDRVAFTATGTDPDGTITGRTWLVDGTAAGSGASFERTFAAGSYEVALEATDDGGATATARETVTVGGGNEAPTAAFDADPTEANVSETVALDAGGSFDPDGSIASYEWTFGDGNASTGETTSHAYGATGDYVVTLTVTDDEGATASDTETVAVTAAPVADPGSAFRDIDRDGKFTEETDQLIPDAEIEDGVYDAGDDQLVIPSSVDAIDAGGSTVDLRGEGLIVAVDLDSDTEIRLDGRGGSIVATDVALDNYQNTNGDGQVRFVADGSIDVSGSTVDSARKISLDGGRLTLTDATLNNYQNTNGGGAITLTGPDGIDAADSSLQTAGDIVAVAGGGPVDLEGATLDNYQNTNGDGSVRVTADADLNLRDARVDTGGDIDLSGREVDVSGSSLDNYQNSNGDGSLRLDATGDIDGIGTTFDSGREIRLTADGMELSGATLDNYQGSNGDGRIELDADGAIDAPATTFDSAKGIDLSAGALAADDAVFDNYQGSNGDGEIDLSVQGAIGANRTRFDSARRIALSADGSIDLGEATLDNYQNTNGDGEIAVEAGGDLAASDTTVDSAKAITLSGRSVDLTDGRLDNYQNSNGGGEITVRTDGGDAVLERTRLDSQKKIVGDVDGTRSIRVEGAEILNKGKTPGNGNPNKSGKPTMTNENGAMVVGEPARGRVG